MTTILIKKKDTAGAPVAGDLTNAAGGAEIAVNTATKRIYSKDSGGNIIEMGTFPSSMAVQGNLSATGNTTLGDASSDSLTINGTAVSIPNNLNFDSGTLFIDSANNRVGFGTASPGYPVDMTSSGSVTLHLASSQTGSSAYATVRFDQADTTAYGYVGVGGASVTNTGLRDSMYIGTSSANNLVLMTSDIAKLRINSNYSATFGNNIVASAWGTSLSSFEVGYNNPSLALYSNGSGALFTNNVYFDGTNWKYSKNSDYGAVFNANDNNVGSFAWYTVTQGGGSSKDTTATLNKKMTLGQNGVLTLWDTTYAWTSSVGAIDLRLYGSVSSDSSYAYLGSNIYYDGANNLRKTNGGVGLLGVGNGGGGLSLQMQYAGSGSPGSTISFSTAFAVDTSGNFGIKTTSMGAPLAFADAAGDKIQFNAANANQYKIGLASGGTGDAIMRLTAGSTGAGDYQFYTGSSQKLGIAADGRVIIGTDQLSSWGSSVSVLEFTGSARGQAYIGFNGLTNPIGYIYSNAYYNGSNNVRKTANPVSVLECGYTAYKWYFGATGSAGSTVSLTTPQATLNSSGYLGLNSQTNPRVPLQLGNGSGQMLAVYDDNNSTPTRLGLGIDLTGFSYELASFIGSSAGPDGKWTYSNWNSTSNSYTRVATISQNGIGLSTENPTSGVGIKFPASQSASSNGNTLDDYEEGNWTPRLSGTTGGEYTPSGLNGGRYVKVGKLVFATCSLQWSAVVSAFSGNLIVNGLPFANASLRAAGSMGAVNGGLSFTSGYSEWNYLIDPGYSYCYIIQNATGGAGYSHTPTVSSSGLVYAMSIVYEADN